MRPEQGGLFVVEGMGGAGKTLATTAVAQKLNSDGIRTVFTREPGGAPAAEFIRPLIFQWTDQKLIGGEGQLAMFSLARAFWVNEVVKPNVDNGLQVLTDRSYVSTAVYQGIAEGVNLDQIERLSRLVMGDYQPRAVILLDLDVKTAIARRLGEGANNDPFDKRDTNYFQKIRDGYRLLAEKKWAGLNWHIVDAEQSPGEVVSNVYSIVRTYI